MSATTSPRCEEGQNPDDPLVSPETWRQIEEKHPHLSTSQRAAVEQILTSHDKIIGLEGVAGAGKTTSLAAVREAAEHEGYKVLGLAPTSRAAHKLAESGIESDTLQRHLRPRRAARWRTEAALRSGRIESCKHETDERVPASACTAATACFWSATSGNMRR